MAGIGSALRLGRRLILSVDRRVFSVSRSDRLVQRPFARQRVRRETILIAPPSAAVTDPTGGNIGDRAMIESFLDNVGGPIRVVVARPDNAGLPASVVDRVCVEEMPALIYGSGLANLRAFLKLRRRLATASHLAVIGADVMDGAYNREASRNRSRVARAGAVLGADSRVLGFSWNSTPEPTAAQALRQAGDAGAALLLRDPVSFERAAADGISGITQVADIVFSARETSDDAVRRLLGDQPGRYGLVNVSGLIGRSIDQTADYDDAIAVMLRHGLQVVLLPHVSWADADDIAACRKVYQRHRGDKVHLVEELLPPAQVRGFCRGARIVVTGRMHLSIMALSNAVPAVALSTQGKVEGLFRLFDIPQCSVDPVPGFGRALSVAVEQTLQDADMPVRIADALVEVQRLSELNFQRLPGLTGTRAVGSLEPARSPS